MTNQDKLQQQILALVNARNALLNQQPTDMLAVSTVNEQIITLSTRLSSLSSAVAIQPISADEQNTLTGAVQDLDIAIDDSYGVTEIIKGATSIANL